MIKLKEVKEKYEGKYFYNEDHKMYFFAKKARSVVKIEGFQIVLQSTITIAEMFLRPPVLNSFKEITKEEFTEAIGQVEIFLAPYKN